MIYDIQLEGVKTTSIWLPENCSEGDLCQASIYALSIIGKVSPYKIYEINLIDKGDVLSVVNCTYSSEMPQSAIQ